MTAYLFGKDIARKFYPLEDNEPIDLPSQAPSIYIFSTMPSLSDARSGTGAIASTAYWVETYVSPYQRAYTILAIPDPSPTSATPRETTYFEAVNFVTKASGQTQTHISAFDVEKPRASETVPGTTVQDLKDIYPKIASYYNDTELARYLVVAQDMIKIDLRAKDVDWGDIDGLKNLKYALAYLTIQYCAEAQIVESGDKHTLRADIYSRRYEALMGKIKIPYDPDGDGIKDQETSQPWAITAAR